MIDNNPITTRSLELTYHIKGDNFERAYRESLSSFPEWIEKGNEGEHAEKWMVRSVNLGESMAIDETAFSKGELHTFMTNKSAKCRKGTIAVMAEGTNASEISSVILENTTEEERNIVREITMDFSDSMHCIAETCFPKAMITIDLFHLIRLCTSSLQELRVRRSFSTV